MPQQDPAGVPGHGRSLLCGHRRLSPWIAWRLRSGSYRRSRLITSRKGTSTRAASCGREGKLRLRKWTRPWELAQVLAAWLEGHHGVVAFCAGCNTPYLVQLAESHQASTPFMAV